MPNDTDRSKRKAEAERRKSTVHPYHGLGGRNGQTAIGFAFGKSTLSAEAKQELLHRLDTMAGLIAMPTNNFVLKGYASHPGAEAANHALAMRRAVSVKDFMVEQGIDPGRIQVRSLGEMEYRTKMAEVGDNDDIDNPEQRMVTIDTVLQPEEDTVEVEAVVETVEKPKRFSLGEAEMQHIEKDQGFYIYIPDPADISIRKFTLYTQIISDLYNLIPIVGTIKGAYEGLITGEDAFTGKELDNFSRILNCLGGLGAAMKAFKLAATTANGMKLINTIHTAADVAEAVGATKNSLDAYSDLEKLVKFEIKENEREEQSEQEADRQETNQKDIDEQNDVSFDMQGDYREHDFQLSTDGEINNLVDISDRPAESLDTSDIIEQDPDDNDGGNLTFEEDAPEAISVLSNSNSHEDDADYDPEEDEPDFDFSDEADITEDQEQNDEIEADADEPEEDDDADDDANNDHDDIDHEPPQPPPPPPEPAHIEAPPA